MNMICKYNGLHHLQIRCICQPSQMSLLASSTYLFFACTEFAILCFSIQMYKDVVQFERLLRAIYRPQNVYCINVDKSSPRAVHAGMEALVKCFDNVVLANVDVTWATFSQVEADLVSIWHRRVCFVDNYRSSL